tara:strand:+ start:192 stop:1202 length:1011 start_codon:yes stop_codon:yes gene_type:complete
MIYTKNIDWLDTTDEKLYDLPDWVMEGYTYKYQKPVNQKLFEKSEKFMKDKDLVEIKDNITGDLVGFKYKLKIPVINQKGYKHNSKLEKCSPKKMKEALKYTSSLAQAARYIEVDYKTFIKYAKKHKINLEPYKNQSGLGISKPNPLSDNSRKLKYWDKNNLPKTKAVVYWIGLDATDVRDFWLKWKCNPIKVGKADDVVKRTTEVLSEYYPKQLPQTEMWEEWLDKAKPQGWFELWTSEEAKKMESALHKLMRRYKMEDTGRATELFSISWENFFKYANYMTDFTHKNTNSQKLIGETYKKEEIKKIENKLKKKYEKIMEEKIQQIKKDILEIVL